MNTFEIKTGDLEPAMVLVCSSGGAALDISSALSARVVITHPTATLPLVDATAEILDSGVPANRGQVKYEWQAGETDISGNYRIEVQIEWSPGRVQTFPGAGYQRVRISPDLG